LLKNSQVSYGWVAIALHWLMVPMILFLFGLGLYMVELSYYDAWYKGALELHKSIGVTVFGLLCVRLLWRQLNIRPMPTVTDNAVQKVEQLAAHWMHLALYFVMGTLMLSGYLISTADGRGIFVFELFDLPALPVQFEKQEDIAGSIHYMLALSLIAMVSFHALAAIKHHFIDKDNTLKKMFKPVQK